jgi:NhaB family Na+:H+ antiporter
MREIFPGVGTAIGGCTTLVGEPQNLVIAKRLDWDFITFMVKMAPITIIVWPVGIVTCIALEIRGKTRPMAYR